MKDYSDVVQFLSSNFDEVNGYDFYKDIFPNNENVGELNNDFSKPNAIYLYHDYDSNKKKRRIMLNDSWENDYCTFVESNSSTLCGGLTYRGRTNRLIHAQAMNALIFDLDGVGLQELMIFFHRTTLEANHLRSIKMPTYIVASGTGLHLYYVFDKPIDLYPNIKVQLKAMKYDLTFRIWDYNGTSKERKIQYQSINQSFRMVGSINDKYNVLVRAFKTGSRVSLDELNQYVDKKESQVDINEPFSPSKITKEQAKIQFPEWYQRVVIDGNKNAKKWDIKGKQGYALYEWWRKRVEEIEGGHRYFYLMCLCIYATKCDVPFKKLKQDMEEDFKILSKVGHSNKLTKEDLESALETYSREYYNFKIADIEKLSGLRIERNKRNGRKQDKHLQGARAIRDINNENWRKGNGRKNKSKIVKEWKKNHPNGKKSECIKATKLDKKTVYKWWDD